MSRRTLARPSFGKRISPAPLQPVAARPNQAPLRSRCNGRLTTLPFGPSVRCRSIPWALDGTSSSERFTTTLSGPIPAAWARASQTVRWTMRSNRMIHPPARWSLGCASPCSRRRKPQTRTIRRSTSTTATATSPFPPRTPPPACGTQITMPCGT